MKGEKESEVGTQNVAVIDIYLTKLQKKNCLLIYHDKVIKLSIVPMATVALHHIAGVANNFSYIEWWVG